MKARKRPVGSSSTPVDASTVTGESRRNVITENGKTSTEYVSDTTIEDVGGKSRRIVKNRDGKSETAYARKRKPTAPVKVGPSRPGTTMANFNPGRSYSEIEKEVRPGISDAQSVADLERVKRMIR